MKKANETALVKTALEYLKLCGFSVVWRSNTGSMVREYRGKIRFVKFGVPGVADIIGCAPDGRFFAAEAKVGRNVASDDQQEFGMAVKRSRGVWFTFWTLEELRENLEASGYKTVPLA